MERVAAAMTDMQLQRQQTRTNLLLGLASLLLDVQSLGLGEHGLHALVLGLECEALLERADGGHVVLQVELRSAEARVALGPRGLQLHALERVAQGRLELAAVDLGGRAVGEVDVVGGVPADGVREVLHGLLVLLGLEGLVAERLELVCAQLLLRVRHGVGVRVDDGL